jgi:hypothetical protein
VKGKNLFDIKAMAPVQNKLENALKKALIKKVEKRKIHDGSDMDEEDITIISDTEQ